MSVLQTLPRPVALVCGVGERNAPAQAGLLAAVSADGWRPDMVVGSSAGAVCAAAAIARPDDAADVAGEMWQGIVASGLVDPGWTRIAAAMTGNETAKVNKQWRRVLTNFLGDARFGENSRDALVALELPQGAPWLVDQGSLVEAVITSAAFPVFVNPITQGNSTLIDGGFIAPIPVLQAVSRGAASAVVLSTGTAAADAAVIAPTRWYDVVLSAIRSQVGAKGSHDLAEAGLRVPIVIVDAAKPDVIHWADVDARIAAGQEVGSEQLAQLNHVFLDASQPGVYAVAREITGDMRLSGVIRQPNE